MSAAFPTASAAIKEYVFNNEAERKMSAVDLKRSAERHDRRCVVLIEQLKREAFQQSNKNYMAKGFTQFGRQTPREVVMVNHWGNRFTTLIFDGEHNHDAGRNGHLHVRKRAVQLKEVEIPGGICEVEEAQLKQDPMTVRAVYKSNVVFEGETLEETVVLQKIQSSLLLLFFCDDNCAPLTAEKMKELSALNEMVLCTFNGEHYELLPGCQFVGKDLDKREIVTLNKDNADSKIVIQARKITLMQKQRVMMTLDQQSDDELTSVLYRIELAQIEPEKMGIIVRRKLVEQTSYSKLCLRFTGKMNVSGAPNAFLQLDEAF